MLTENSTVKQKKKESSYCESKIDFLEKNLKSLKERKGKTERRKNMDIDIDGYAERYWSAFDPAFQDDEEENEYEEEDEGEEDENIF